jgi:hypothetical protein
MENQSMAIVVKDLKASLEMQDNEKFWYPAIAKEDD